MIHEDDIRMLHLAREDSTVICEKQSDRTASTLLGRKVCQATLDAVP